MGIKFKCPKNGDPDGESVEIEVPDRCPTCNYSFRVIYKGWGNNSQFGDCCDHVGTYLAVWSIRVSGGVQEESTTSAEYGVSCRSCNDYFPHAERVEEFKCWNCKTYPHYG